MMEMKMKKLFQSAMLGSALFAGAASAQVNAIINDGFEAICPPADRWTAFGNAASINFYMTTGTHAIKMFGPFNAPIGYTGIFQDVDANPGETWEAHGFVTCPDWDALSWNAGTGAGSRAFIEIQFVDINGSVISGPQQNISSKLDHHTAALPIQQTVAPCVAPPGTAKARIGAFIEQGNYVGGAAWYDDLTINRVGQATANLNTSFEDQGPGCLGSPFQGWVNFGNGQANYGESPRNGHYAAKLFGGYYAPTALSGWFQDVPAAPGTHWRGSGWCIARGNDLIQAGNDVFVSVEFRDSSGNNISEYETYLSPYRSPAVPTGASNDLMYHYFEMATDAVAPDFTTQVRFLIFQRQVNYAGGATWWDDMQLFQTDQITCFADFNQDGGVDGGDVAAFFTAWERGDTSADTNLDGGVDGSDVATFYMQWEAGGC